MLFSTVGNVIPALSARISKLSLKSAFSILLTKWITFPPAPHPKQ